MPLDEKSFGPDPLPEFSHWMEHARANAGLRNPGAMTLCTVGPDGSPQGRMVLLKAWSAEGFTFYTNSRSEKGLALAAHPLAELVLHWDSLGRQIRIRGPVQPLGEAETRAYFATRPRGSQLAAWASQQSHPTPSRADLEARYAAQEKRFEGKPPPFGDTDPRFKHWPGPIKGPTFRESQTVAVKAEGQP